MDKKIMMELINEVVNVNGKSDYEQERYWGILYNECINILRKMVNCKKLTFFVDWNQEDFEEEVMIKVHKSLDTYDSTRGCFSTWLCTIAIRLYCKHNQNGKKISTTPMYVGNDDNESLNIIDYYRYGHSVEKDYFYNLGYEKLYDAIDKLKENYRDVVILCDIEGLKPREVAKVLGCKSKDVQQWLYRAHKSLEKFILNEEMEEDLSYEYEL